MEIGHVVFVANLKLSNIHCYTNDFVRHYPSINTGGHSGQPHLLLCGRPVAERPPALIINKGGRRMASTSVNAPLTQGDHLR
jgi:hypothetical protein